MMVVVITDAAGVHVADQLLDSGLAGPGLLPLRGYIQHIPSVPPSDLQFLENVFGGTWS